MTFKVAITGGIGTGKTTVAKLFELLGVPVYYSDKEAKILMQTNPILKDQISTAFGSATYQNGKLNRQYLSERVFKDPKQLELLNSFVHPAVARDQDEWFANQEVSYALSESALIYEIGRADYFDQVIVVDAEDSVRIERVAKRDSVDETTIRKRMVVQMPQHQKTKLAHFVIQNNNKVSLIQQVLKVDSVLRKLAADKTNKK